MKYINNFENYNENIKSFLLGTLLFLSACSNIKSTDKDGNEITPKNKEIVGIVSDETTLPSKSGYTEMITVIDKDGNTFDFKEYSSMLINDSWEIEEGDSVRVVFDSKGNAKVYKK